MPRARATIDTLCSEEFAGRGYLDGGDRKAADLIARRFAAAGLKPFGDGYFQRFEMDVNVFPEKLTLKLDKAKLVPGRDYLVSAESASGEGKGELLEMPATVFSDRQARADFLATDVSGRVVCMPQPLEARLFDSGDRQLIRHVFSAAATILVAEKLTHRIARQQYKPLQFVVKKSVFDRLAPKKARFSVKAELLQGYQTQNVVGYFEGTAQPDSFLVFTAHYDHLGRMGERAYFPGANDNASGVAMLLELAHHYKENPPAYSVAFMAFGGEEAGIVGSKFYVDRPLFPLERISFLLNIDLFATGENGMTAVNGSVFKRRFAKLVEVNEAGDYLPAILERGRAANSDHHFFTEAGVPCFFFYLMGDWTHYHDVHDAPPVPLGRFEEAFGLLTDFAEALQKGD